MKKSELLELLKSVNDDGDIDEILSGSDLAKALLKSGLTLDAFKEKIDTDKEFKSYLDSINDKYFQKANKTWVANNLERLVEEEIIKRDPSKAKTPEQLELESIRKELAAEKAERKKAEMTSKFKDILVNKNIPSTMINLLLREEEDATNENINLFEESMKSYVDSQVMKRLGDSNYTPPSGGADKTQAQIIAEKRNNDKESEPVGPNPWA